MSNNTEGQQQSQSSSSSKSNRRDYYRRNHLPPLNHISHRHRSETGIDAINNLNIDYESFLHPNNNHNGTNDSTSNVQNGNGNANGGSSEVPLASSSNANNQSLTQSLVVDNDIDRLRLSFRSHTIGTIDPNSTTANSNSNTNDNGSSIPHNNTNNSLGVGLGVIGYSGSYIGDHPTISASGSFNIGQSFSNVTSPNHNNNICNTNNGIINTNSYINGSSSFTNNHNGYSNGLNTSCSASQDDTNEIITSYDDPTSINPNSITPIILEAARIGNWDEVNTLAQSHPGSAQFKRDGLLPLHHVCNRRCPNPTVFYNLIKAYPNALMDVSHGNGWTPLHYATRFKCSRDAVRLLLHLYKEKGIYAAKLKCKEKGRTPLYYAIRYDAPDGVVQLLLSCMTKEDILESDKEGKSALGLIWGSYVDSSINGRKMYSQYTSMLKNWKMKEVPWEKRVESAKDLRRKVEGNKLGDCWKRADLLLRGAFKFPLKDDDQKLKQNDDGDLAEGGRKIKKRRTWRILHAAVSMRYHSSLAMMAFVLHPEQVREIDNEDLYEPNNTNDGGSVGDNSNRNYYTNHFTALHLAAKSSMTGRDSQTIISHLLEMYPEAASIINPADNSYPLHYLCANPSKLEWEADIAPVYNAFPEALLRQDINGRTPFHRIFTVEDSRSGTNGGGSSSSSRYNSVPPPPNGTPNGTPTASRYPINPDVSIIQKILTLEPQVASIPDNDGKLPFHSLTECGEVWDENIQSLYDAHPNVISTRTNRQSGSNLPIHLVASNPDAKASLVNKIVELNPRGATIENLDGRLPLHLICESGKSFDGGFETIYNAYPNAINVPERNTRGWWPLHFTVTCPNSTVEQIERVLDLNPNAANVVDGSHKTLLHLAIESGKGWDDGLKMLFEANPDAIEVEDALGRLPLVSALLTYQNSSRNGGSGTRTTTTATTAEEQLSSSSSDEKVMVENEEESQGVNVDDEYESDYDNDQNELVEDDDNLEELHVSQVNVLYHLLKNAPNVLQHTG